jgi:hypothetical protein
MDQILLKLLFKIYTSPVDVIRRLIIYRRGKTFQTEHVFIIMLFKYGSREILWIMATLLLLHDPLNLFP